VFVAMVGGDGGVKRTLSYKEFKGEKKEGHRNNYKDLNLLICNKMRKQYYLSGKWNSLK
jgi:hypothetical protein